MSALHTLTTTTNIHGVRRVEVGDPVFLSGDGCRCFTRKIKVTTDTGIVELTCFAADEMSLGGGGVNKSVNTDP